MSQEGLEEPSQGIDLAGWRQYVNTRSDQMTLEEFQRFWNVSDRKILMEICGCSKSIVDHWFLSGTSYCPPTKYHERRLAEAHHHFMALQTMPHRFPMLYFRILSVGTNAAVS